MQISSAFSFTVDGVWGSWQSAEDCGVCQRNPLNQILRSRMCDNPRPETGGEKCEGPDEDYISCAENGCQGKFCTDAYNYNNIYMFRLGKIANNDRSMFNL